MDYANDKKTRVVQLNRSSRDIFETLFGRKIPDKYGYLAINQDQTNEYFSKIYFDSIIDRLGSRTVDEVKIYRSVSLVIR